MDWTRPDPLFIKWVGAARESVTLNFKFNFSLYSIESSFKFITATNDSSTDSATKLIDQAHKKMVKAVVGEETRLKLAEGRLEQSSATAQVLSLSLSTQSLHQ